MHRPRWMLEGGEHVWRPYCQHRTAGPPLAVSHAHGARLVLTDGRELVDGIASWWTAAHGYGNEHIASRIEEQLRTLPHIAFGGLAHEAAYTLATRLSDRLPNPLHRVFFVESGSVAVEVALKIAIQSFHNQGDLRRRKVVCFEGAYHGDTFATMALCDPVDGMHRAFSGLGIDAIHFPVPEEGDTFEAELARVADEVASVIIEPLVQCAGGMRFHPPAVLRRLREACDDHGIPLIFDEIATGFYRTGASFAMERAGVVPDIVTLGKALTGGTLPLAAAVATDELFDRFLGESPLEALQHGPTYMGNPLSCAAAHASLDLFERGDMGSKVQSLETKLREGLSPFLHRVGVRDVRVMGGIGVIEMAPGAAPTSDVFASHGAFLRPLRLRSADVLYLMPPLIIEDHDLHVLFDSIAAALKE